MRLLLDTQTHPHPHTHLEGEAVVSGGLILAPVVLSVVNIYMIQLQEAHQVFRGLEEKQEKMMSFSFILLHYSY